MAECVDRQIVAQHIRADIQPDQASRIHPAFAHTANTRATMPGTRVSAGHSSAVLGL
jgi:hypothetical protein